jgi:hypothetical protein
MMTALCGFNKLATSKNPRDGVYELIMCLIRRPQFMMIGGGVLFQYSKSGWSHKMSTLDLP